jgi:outer membrane protein OmpA-like peptidoglycan-associated protein
MTMRQYLFFFTLLLTITAFSKESPYLEIKGVSINSKLPEMSPTIYKNGVVYATTDGTTDKKGNAYTDLYFARADSSNENWTKSRLLKGKVNELFHEAAVTFLSRKRILFTRNSIYKGKKKITKKNVLKLDIFEAELNDDGEWIGVKPFQWNNAQYSVGHPTWSAREKRLYFASDMPGGKGGIDIYFSKWDGENWSEPKNMGSSVNTDADEMFPCIAPNQSLYFSSSRAGGLGGLDFYVLERDTINNQWTETITQLQDGMNSSNDDFGVAFYDDMKSGFFTSDRSGGKGSDDIYFFKWIVPEIPEVINTMIDARFEVRNLTTNEPLPNAKLTLRDEKSDSLFFVFSDENGVVNVLLDSTKQYQIVAEKDSFLKKKIEAFVPTRATTPIGLMKIEVNKSYEVKNILYDLDKADVREDAKANLKVVIDMLKDNPDVKIELSSHTDSRGSDAYNLDLSDRRAKAVAAYIVSQGITEERVVGKGYGETQLKNKCKNAVKCTEEEHEQNRRTEFKVLGMK